jgi:hypothetical protein
LPPRARLTKSTNDRHDQFLDAFLILTKNNPVPLHATALGTGRGALKSFLFLDTQQRGDCRSPTCRTPSQ